jgi:hypothetical protein
MDGRIDPYLKWWCVRSEERLSSRWGTGTFDREEEGNYPEGVKRRPIQMGPTIIRSLPTLLLVALFLQAALASMLITEVDGSSWFAGLYGLNWPCSQPYEG